MNRCLLFSLLLLAAFGVQRRAPIEPPPDVPADLLQPCSGYSGPVPRNEGQLSDALIAEVRGRDCANSKLYTIGEILTQAKSR